MSSTKSITINLKPKSKRLHSRFSTACLWQYKSGEETTRKVIVDRVLDHLELPDDLRSKEYSKIESGQNILANRIRFCVS